MNARLTDLTLREFADRLATSDPTPGGGSASAFALPKRTPAEKDARKEAMQAALLAAARVPLDAAKAARRLLALCERLLEHATAGAISDAGVAALLAEASIRGAALNVMINLASLADATHVKALSEELDRAVDGAEALRAALVERVEAK